jgi:hypothetical protein
MKQQAKTFAQMESRPNKWFEKKKFKGIPLGNGRDHQRHVRKKKSK